MPHRAAVYAVQVYKKRKPKDTRPFGDIDGSGTWLADRICGYLSAGQEYVDTVSGKRARCETAVIDGHEVHATALAGESGFVADIHDRSGIHRLRQAATDTQFVRCASVFQLDPSQKFGWWAVHVNHGRSAKRLLEKHLIERFAQDHEDLTLRVDPSVNSKVLREAIAQGKLDAVSLTRWEQPSDRATASTDTWVKASDKAKLETRITGERGHRLKTALLERFLDGERALLDDIVTFNDIRYDEAKVSVELGDGRRRSFNIETPESGQAFSRDIPDGNLSFRDGEPTPASLFGQLGDVLADMT